MNTKRPKSVFAPADDAVLEYIRAHNERRQVTLSDLSNSRSIRYVQAAYLLNWLLGAGSDKDITYRTFFANSGLEATSGALKLARAGRAAGQNPTVLIYDPSEELRISLNPLGAQRASEALVPGVLFADSVPRLAELVHTTEHCAVLLRGTAIPSASPLNEVLRFAGSRGSTRILDLAGLALESTRTSGMAVEADIVVFAEELTRRQVPIGAFCARSELWERASLTHFSTFGGNELALGVALENLLQKLDVPNDVVGQIENFATPEYARRGRATWVYPSGVWAISDTAIARGEGPYIHLGSDKPCLDLDGNSGCNIRGHCPPDVPELLAEWDPLRDYWEEFSELLKAQTGLHGVFPAVSGATANEIALTLALAAALPRRRVITFRGNFGGRTLGSCCLQAPVSPNHPAYGPLYSDVVEIDPTRDDALECLEQELDRGDVAAIWIQALLYPPVKGRLSKDLLACIQRRRDTEGFFVAFDEIKTGLWRTGPLLASSEQFVSPDIVTLAKHLSDMTFPVGVVAAGQRIVEAAQSNFPDLVAGAQTYYKNQIGACVALHVLRWGLENDLEGSSRQLSSHLWNGLRELMSKYDSFTQADGLGLHVWTTISQPEQDELLAGLFERGVLVPQGAFNLPLTAKESDVDVYLNALDACLNAARQTEGKC